MNFYERYKTVKELPSKELLEEILSYEKSLDHKIEPEEYILYKLYFEEIESGNYDHDYYGTESLLDQFPVNDQLHILDKFVNNVHAYYYVTGNGLFGMEI